MSSFYNPARQSNLYRPGDQKPFRISRSKIDLFLDCPRCLSSKTIPDPSPDCDFCRYRAAASRYDQTRTE